MPNVQKLVDTLSSGTDLLVKCVAVAKRPSWLGLFGHIVQTTTKETASYMIASSIHRHATAMLCSQPERNEHYDF